MCDADEPFGCRSCHRLHGQGLSKTRQWRSAQESRISGDVASRDEQRDRQDVQVFGRVWQGTRHLSQVWQEERQKAQKSKGQNRGVALNQRNAQSAMNGYNIPICTYMSPQSPTPSPLSLHLDIGRRGGRLYFLRLRLRFGFGIGRCGGG